MLLTSISPCIRLFYSAVSLCPTYLVYYLKKNLNAPRPSEHPPVRGKLLSLPALFVLFLFVTRYVATLLLFHLFLPCFGFYCLKKNQNAPRPSEHPPVMGEKCQDVLVGALYQLVDVPLIYRTTVFLSREDHVVPDWQPLRILMGMVEARPINVKNTQTHTHTQSEYGDEQADVGRDCRTRLARPNSKARTRTEKYSFSLFS